MLYYFTRPITRPEHHSIKETSLTMVYGGPQAVRTNTLSPKGSSVHVKHMVYQLECRLHHQHLLHLQSNKSVVPESTVRVFRCEPSRH